MSFIEKLKQRTVQAAKETIEKVTVTEEVRVIRIALCDECPSLSERFRTCKECGCFVDAKTRIASSTCPLGKW